MSEHRLNVLHIFSTLPVGGAEMLMLNIVKNIDRGVFDITICCLGEKGVIGEQIEVLGVEVISLKCKKIGGFNLSLILRLRDFIKERGFDIVHTHMYHANLYGRIAAWVVDVPVIFSSVHNIYRKRKLHRMLINYLLSKITDRIFVATPAVFEDVRRYDRVSAEKIEVLPYGIDTDSFTKKYDRNIIRENLGLSPEDYVIGNVARLEEAKGQRYLIEAIRILQDRGIKTKCLIIGSGSLEKELKELTINNKLDDTVIFPGTRQDLPEIFSVMDVFVFPSLWEGLPLALLSAMAAGVPVIATHAGGIKDVLVDNRNGIVVPQSDPSAIAEAVKRLMSDEKLRKSLTEEAKKNIEEYYSAKVMVKKLENIYRTIAFT